MQVSKDKNKLIERRRTRTKCVGSLLKAAHFFTFIPDRQGWESSEGAK
jgi:hypothetical protein